MQVTLTPRAEELVQELVHAFKEPPDAVIEYALESLAHKAPLTEEGKERRRKAVEGILEFQRKHHLTLGPGETIKDLIEEGRKY